MKNLILASFFANLFGFGLLSCNDEGPDINEVNQQTILVYMPWSGSASGIGLYNNFRKNLQDIESAIVERGGLGKTRVLVFFTDSIRRSDLKPVSVLYEIRLENKACVHDTLKIYSGNLDNTTAEGIAMLLTDMRNSAEALNYALVIGCHGAGWTQKDIWNNFPYNAKEYRLPARMPMPAAIADGEGEEVGTRFFGGSPPYTADTETLAEGIRLSGLHMQFILFDVCYMANVEVAYELRDVTNYLIASTSEILGEGMPYLDLWKSINSQTPDYGGAVNTFYQYYLNHPKTEYRYGTLAAIDCRQIEALASIMKEINEHYTFDESQVEKLQPLDGFLDSSVSTYGYFDPTGTNFEPIFFDMGDYVGKLCTDPYLYEKFNAQLSKIVKSRASTEQIIFAAYGWSWRKHIDVNTFSGLTISDPSRHFVALRGKERTAWWKATH